MMLDVGNFWHAFITGFYPTFLAVPQVLFFTVAACIWVYACVLPFTYSLRNMNTNTMLTRLCIFFRASWFYHSCTIISPSSTFFHCLWRSILMIANRNLPVPNVQSDLQYCYNDAIDDDNRTNSSRSLTRKRLSNIYDSQ